MRRLIILALLALAPASVASAQSPYRDRPRDYTYDRDGRHDRGRYDDGMYDRDGRRNDRWGFRRRWAPIVEGNSAATDRQFINVLGRGGRFNRLLVEGVRGAPVIQRVAVEYLDPMDPTGRQRQTQVYDLNTRLPRGADEVIDLGSRKRIHRIVVYTDPAYRGAYSIYGT